MRIIRLVTAVVVAFLVSAVPVAASPSNDQVCRPGDSGKIDVVADDVFEVTITARDGYLIMGYCVKAGSENQDLGPEYVRVNPAQKSVTIRHSSGKAISHYSYTVCEVGDHEPPETTTTSTTMAEPPPEPPQETTTTQAPPEPPQETTTTTSAPPDTTVPEGPPPEQPEPPLQADGWFRPTCDGFQLITTGRSDTNAAAGVSNWSFVVYQDGDLVGHWEGKDGTSAGVIELPPGEYRGVLTLTDLLGKTEVVDDRVATVPDCAPPDDTPVDEPTPGEPILPETGMEHVVIAAVGLAMYLGGRRLRNFRR